MSRPTEQSLGMNVDTHTLGMTAFPAFLHVRFKRQFPAFHRERALVFLRAHVYEKIVAGDENDYIQLREFADRHNVSDADMKANVATVMDELAVLGWTCTLAFGETGLFVYEGSVPPPSCHTSETFDSVG